jgi:hypothetical protein
MEGRSAADELYADMCERFGSTPTGGTAEMFRAIAEAVTRSRLSSGAAAPSARRGWAS